MNNGIRVRLQLTMIENGETRVQVDREFEGAVICGFGEGGEAMSAAVGVLSPMAIMAGMTELVQHVMVKGERIEDDEL